MKSTEQQHVPALSFSCATTYDSTKSMRRYKGSSDAEVTHFVVTQLYMYLGTQFQTVKIELLYIYIVHLSRSISVYIAKMTSKKPQNGRKNARKAFHPIKVIAPTAHAPCARFRRIPSQFSSLPFLSDFLVRPTRNSNEGERSPNSLVKIQCLHEIRYSLFYFFKFFLSTFFFCC